MKVTVVLLLILLASIHYKTIGGFDPIRRYYSHGNYIHHLGGNIKPIVERVTLQSRERSNSDSQLTRSGILVRYPHAQANVVICHGFMCDKFDVGFLRNLFPQGEFNFLTFDFRAHGENRQGQCCTFGRDEAYDVQAAANFFRKNPELKKLPTFVYGFSMGAVASIEAQAMDSSLFDAMILDCPFDSSESVVKKALQSMKFSLFGYEFDIPGRSYLERYAFHPYVQAFIKFMLKTVAHMDSFNIKTYIGRFSPAESAKKISVPCLFIHCKQDQRVPIKAIQTVYKGVQGPKRLWLTNGRHHYDSIFYNPEKYAKRITKFFEMVMDGQIFKDKKELIIEDKKDVLREVKTGGV